MNVWISRHIFLIILAVLILVTVVGFLGTRAHVQWVEQQYFGEIIEIRNGGFLLRDRDTEEILILTRSETLVKQGRTTLRDGLRVGAHVIVVGTLDQNGAIRASLIRIIDVGVSR